MTAIINDQKQNLNKYLDENATDPHTIKQIDASFTASKLQWDTHIKSIQSSLSSASSAYTSKIDEILRSAKHSHPLNINPSQITDKSLTNHRVYAKLNASIHPTTSFNYQYVKDAEIPFVTAINILIEYLPNKIIENLFEFLPNHPPNFTITNYLTVKNVFLSPSPCGPISLNCLVSPEWMESE